MTVNVIVDMIHPHIHIRKDTQSHQDCRLVDIMTEENTTITLHFANMADVDAFIGALTMTREST